MSSVSRASGASGQELKYQRQAEQIALEDARRLAREAQKQALRDEWRDYLSAQPSEEELPTSSITSAVYRGALIACLRIAQGDTEESCVNADGETVTRKVSNKDRVRACEAIFRLRMDEARLVAEMRGETTPQNVVQLQAAQIPQLEQFGEQLTEVLQLRRKLAARGA